MFLYISCIFSWDMSIFSMFLWRRTFMRMVLHCACVSNPNAGISLRFKCAIWSCVIGSAS